jgi:hypothetical protein
MFDGIYPLLAEFNPALTREQWRLLVDYPWRAADDPMGYVLLDGEQIVGFISTLYSRRTIGGRTVRFCNTAHWVVKEAYRSESLRLLMMVLRQRDCTITNLTSSAAVSALFAKLGFKVLDRNVLLSFPTPVLPRFSDDVAITANVGEIAESLSGVDARIQADHAGLPVGHVMLRDGHDTCYLLFTRLHRRVLGVSVPYCHVQYVSDPELLARHRARVSWFLLRRFGAVCLAVDERLVAGRAADFGKARPLGEPRYYRSDALGAAQIDNLYTELAVGVY